MPVLKVELSARGARNLWFGLVAFLVLSTIAIIVLGELALRRWAPWASNEGISVLAAWVWMYHFLPIFRKQRSLLGGVGRAFLYTTGVAAVIVGALYLAHG